MRLTLLFFLLLTVFSVTGQNAPAGAPFIIQGELTGFKEKELIFFYRDPKKSLKDYTIQTAKVDSAGKFYLKTYAVTRPMIATLRKGNISVDVYAAPGYNLTLTGDVRDPGQFIRQKKITGTGAESNQYLLAQDAVMYALKDSVPWYDMKQDALVKFVKKDVSVRDSLYQKVFGKNTAKDQWFNAFARLTRLNNTFLDTYYLLSLVTYDSAYTAKSAALFLAANTDKKLWANLYNEENLASENYISWFMGTYPEYLRKLALLENPDYAKQKDDIALVREISSYYKGQIREIKLFAKMKNLITYCRSFEELVGYQNKMPQYIASLKSGADQNELALLLQEKQIELANAQIGKQAPLFEAADSSGIVHKLSEYKGKVVYLDLWASWCAPCRAQAVHLKKLSEKYAAGSGVVFISVAVMDKPDKWKGALIKDQPDGLQLYDTDGSVQKAYFASSIPKFILINKKGEIVSFDAPAPSSGEPLHTMLDKEIRN